MRPANVFQLELAAAFAGGGSILLKLGLTFLLGSPFVFLNVPRSVASAGLAVLLLFVTFFGAAVSLTRKQREGILCRLRLLPIGRWSVVGDLLLAATVIDLLQMGILLGIYCAVHTTFRSAGAVLEATVLFCATVLLFNLLGGLLGLGLRGNPEAHLAGALSVGLLTFFSGLLPVPPALEGLVGLTARWIPLSALSGVLESGGNGPGAGDAPFAFRSALFLVVLAALILWRSVDWNTGSIRRGT